MNFILSDIDKDLSNASIRTLKLNESQLMSRLKYLYLIISIQLVFFSNQTLTYIQSFIKSKISNFVVTKQIKSMKRIGLLSDTHGCWDDRYEKYFECCDEIWHAGDIGSLEIVDKFEAFKPFRAVYGNIDGYEMRVRFPEINRFKVEETDVMIKHIGGYPGKYDRSVTNIMRIKPPQIFISGHSHILKVMYDKEHDLLHINPGAAGNYGFHHVRTLVRFSIENGKASDLEVIELS